VGVVLAALVVLGLYRGATSALSGERDGLRRLISRPVPASSLQAASQGPLDAEDLASADSETPPAPLEPALSDLPAAEVARQDLTVAPTAGAGAGGGAPDAIGEPLSAPPAAETPAAPEPVAPKPDTLDPATLF
jgi:hypothetical protein